MKAIRCPICRCPILTEFDGKPQEKPLDRAMTHIKKHTISELEEWVLVYFYNELQSVANEKKEQP